jgi:hypothetical protein
VEQGGVLDAHDDIPNSLREQLYAKENQRLEKRKKSSDNFIIGSICPPININNFLLARASQQPIPTDFAKEAIPAKSAFAKPIIVYGLIDVAVEEHTEWQHSQVSNEAFRKSTRAQKMTHRENVNEMRSSTDR